VPKNTVFTEHKTGATATCRFSPPLMYMCTTRLATAVVLFGDSQVENEITCLFIDLMFVAKLQKFHVSGAFRD